LTFFLFYTFGFLLSLFFRDGLWGLQNRRNYGWVIKYCIYFIFFCFRLLEMFLTFLLSLFFRKTFLNFEMSRITESVILFFLRFSHLGTFLMFLPFLFLKDGFKNGWNQIWSNLIRANWTNQTVKALYVFFHFSLNINNLRFNKRF